MQWRATAGLVLVAAVLIGIGCSTGAPGVKRYPTDLQTTMAATPDQIAAAAESTLVELGLTDVNAVASKVDAQATARTAMGKEVKVTATISGQRTTLVKVTHTAGVPLANAVIEGVEARLAEGAGTK